MKLSILDKVKRSYSCTFQYSARQENMRNKEGIRVMPHFRLDDNSDC